MFSFLEFSCVKTKRTNKNISLPIIVPFDENLSYMI